MELKEVERDICKERETDTDFILTIARSDFKLIVYAREKRERKRCGRKIKRENVDEIDRFRERERDTDFTLLQDLISNK